MANEIAKRDGAAMLEKVVIGGDLAELTPAERVGYYQRVCESVGLNPLTKPFDYLRLNNKLTLYAKRDATDQLRKIHGVSIDAPQVVYLDELVQVTVIARDKEGRTDADIGAVSIGNLKGEARANAIMKAITKAKRRATLSICGLGWLDETETESIPGAQAVPVDTETGEIVNGNGNGEEWEKAREILKVATSAMKPTERARFLSETLGGTKLESYTAEQMIAAANAAAEKEAQDES